jgi:hypothetical protein
VLDEEKPDVWLTTKGDTGFIAGYLFRAYVEQLHSGSKIDVEGGECGTVGVFLRDKVDNAGNSSW